MFVFATPVVTFIVRFVIGLIVVGGGTRVFVCILFRFRCIEFVYVFTGSEVIFLKQNI